MCYITYSFIKRNEWGNPLFIIEWGEKMELLESIKEMVLPLIEQNDCYLDDIEYVKDNNEMYLRIYIEKNEGYLDMDTCVAVSELISDKLDETDPIKDEYILEVSSPGIEKPLKTFEQVQKSVGEYVYAKFKNIIISRNNNNSPWMLASRTFNATTPSSNSFKFSTTYFIINS